MATPSAIERQFAIAVLRKWGRPVTAISVRNVLGWMRAEGGHTHNNARFNFLNTTQPEPGAGNTGTQGNIKVYRSLDQGVDATVKTLNNGRYAGIAAAVNADPRTFARAVNASPWGTKSDFSSLISGIQVPTNLGAGAASPSSAALAPGAIPQVAGSIDTKALMRLLNQQRERALRGEMPTADYQSKLTNIAQQALPRAQATTTAQGVGAQVASAANQIASGVGGQAYGTPFGTTFRLPALPAGVQAVAAKSSIQNPKGQTVAIATFDGKPVSQWWASMLTFARAHGWKGSVTSGYRSVAEQQQIWSRHPDPTWVARPGSSPHQYAMAVDISDGPGLERVIRKYHLPIARYAPEGWHFEPLGFRTNGTQRTFT